MVVIGVIYRIMEVTVYIYKTQCLNKDIQRSILHKCYDDCPSVMISLTFVNL